MNGPGLCLASEPSEDVWEIGELIAPRIHSRADPGAIANDLEQGMGDGDLATVLRFLGEPDIKMLLSILPSDLAARVLLQTKEDSVLHLLAATKPPTAQLIALFRGLRGKQKSCLFLPLPTVLEIFPHLDEQEKADALIGRRLSAVVRASGPAKLSEAQKEELLETWQAANSPKETPVHPASQPKAVEQTKVPSGGSEGAGAGTGIGGRATGQMPTALDECNERNPTAPVPAAPNVRPEIAASAQIPTRPTAGLGQSLSDSVGTRGPEVGLGRGPPVSVPKDPPYPNKAVQREAPPTASPPAQTTLPAEASRPAVAQKPVRSQDFSRSESPSRSESQSRERSPLGADSARGDSPPTLVRPNGEQPLEPGRADGTDDGMEVDAALPLVVGPDSPAASPVAPDAVPSLRPPPATIGGGLELEEEDEIETPGFNQLTSDMLAFKRDLEGLVDANPCWLGPFATEWQQEARRAALTPEEYKEKDRKEEADFRALPKEAQKIAGRPLFAKAMIDWKARRYLAVVTYWYYMINKKKHSDRSTFLAT